MHVFAYGTLMFAEVWRVVVGREFDSVRGMVSGYAVYRVQGAVFPGIVAAGENDVVRGVVYLDVDPAALARLDRFEDDFYDRRSLWIDCDDGQRRAAETYVVPVEKREVLTDEAWDSNEFVARGHLTEFIRRFAGFSRLADSD
ncbi:MAG: gamma-glutamylcyclotransferase family protein [Pirellulales bacterium]